MLYGCGEDDVNSAIETEPSTLNYAPSSDEMDELISDYIHDEVLYREALTLGLDRDDGIVRQRMQQKMRFLFEGIVKQVVPRDEVLQTYLDLNADKYRQPARLSFFQVYINKNKRGDIVLADALLLLAQLSDKTADPEVSGDLLMLER
ncbi:MAG: hypothetical protein KUG81_00075 [Gammaproteobacteria bacterium]|nr:hypothetical protein [Gammaproteobacteria bacterium]